MELNGMLASIAAVVLTTGLATQARAQDNPNDRVSCATCTIRTQTILTLGARDSAGALPGQPLSATVDSQGRIWLVVPNRAPLLFARDGSFLREVGRLGDGPGEFQYPSRVMAVGDSVVVFSARGGTNVVGPNLQHARTIARLSVSQLGGVAVIEWPKLVLIAGLDPRARDSVWPLHFVDMSGVAPQAVRSFGDGGGGPLPSINTDRLIQGYPAPDQLFARAVTSSGADGTFGVTKFTQYLVTKWDRNGNAEWQMRRESSWIPRKETWRLGGTANTTPPDARIQAIWYDSRRYLWVVAHVAQPNWQQARREFQKLNPPPPPPPAGSGGAFISRPASQVMPERDLYQTMIEVLDVQARVLLTRTFLPGYVISILPDGRLVGYREAPDGTPHVDIMSATLQRPR
jgi:hypothetical protein